MEYFPDQSDTFNFGMGRDLENLTLPDATTSYFGSLPHISEQTSSCATEYLNPVSEVQQSTAFCNLESVIGLEKLPTNTQPNNSSFNYQSRTNAVNDTNIHSELQQGTEITPKLPLCSEELPVVEVLEKSGLRMKHNKASWKCEKCDKVFSNWTKYRSHKLEHSKQAKEKPYKCDKCNHFSRCPSELKVHQQVHTGEKPFHCDFCKYSCRLLADMKIHRRIHTGEKPFKCDECDFSARKTSNLITHRRVHTGEKPYKCHLCDFAGKQSSTLKVHLRTHSGEKQYKCEKCNCTFNNLQSWKRHKASHDQSTVCHSNNDANESLPSVTRQKTHRNISTNRSNSKPRFRFIKPGFVSLKRLKNSYIEKMCPGLQLSKGKTTNTCSFASVSSSSPHPVGEPYHILNVVRTGEMSSQRVTNIEDITCLPTSILPDVGVVKKRNLTHSYDRVIIKNEAVYL